MTETKSKQLIVNPQFMNIYNPKHLPAKTTKQVTNSEQSVQKSLTPSNISVLETETNANSFVALKKLRETEDHIKKIRGRFKVLKIKQESFRAKTIHHENLLKLNQQTQKYRSQHKNDILNANLERQKEISETKQKNIKLRDQIRQKNKEVRENMLHQKIEENRKLKQQSIQNDKRYKEIKSEDIEEKVEKRKKINEQEKQQRIKIDRYRQSRVNETKDSKTFDMNQLVERNSMKQKQLQELMRMENELEKQHMNSIEASRVLKVRLQSVINRRKGNSNSNGSGTQSLSEETKLPQINIKTNSVRLEFKTVLK